MWIAGPPSAPVTQDDASYYRARAVQEQLAAAKASCDNARDRHAQLAMMYRFRAAMLASPLDRRRQLESIETPRRERSAAPEPVVP